ncbi:signal recognition particle-docking protein FtsY [Amycolatopsis antarctica]|uniref:Signal recognition particle receptor FtsY n=1 Tax=Amycolatopsis antarctica TaxID=1854586 RepID=A0A263D7W9_9PSEU|nr:signal recognition particle-docking protein FtsY [Amycolatopsis antarctica]OZM74098.1 signal recognition particle-docking protein FtsY [Amycolatopsis antarctica]
MSSNSWIWVVVVVVVLLAIALVAGLVVARRRKISLGDSEQAKVDEAKPKGGGYTAGGGISLAPGGTRTEDEPSAGEDDSATHPAGERTEVDGQPGVGDDASVPRDAPRRGIVDVGLPDAPPATEPTETAGATDTTEPGTEPIEAEPTETGAGTTEPEPTEIGTESVQVDTSARPADSGTAGAPPSTAVAPSAPVVEDEIAPATGRIERLRGRLSKSSSSLGQGLLGLLGAGDLDEDSWQDIEDTLLIADLGSATTTEIVGTLRAELSTRGVRTPEQARALLKEVLTDALQPSHDRSVRALPHMVDGAKQPAVVLVAGVNGTGKTTTTGKLARVLVAQGRQVLLGAADTFRAAAADQLQTWSERVGAETVRGKEGADPAAVAFDAVKRGVDTGVDAVLIDTAGRLHTKTGLMDELSKVKRVVEKQAKVDEVLLVLDATTGQNGLAQARVFAEVVDITGIVLTKLDGTAKGGIVFQVQRELGVPVKLVGLGEGPDDLAPFEPSAFVEALLG